MSVATPTRCRCGLPMTLVRHDIYACANCDQVQPIERTGRPRRTTRYDVRLNLFWMNEMNNDYPPLPEGVHPDWVERIFREDTE